MPKVISLLLMMLTCSSAATCIIGCLFLCTLFILLIIVYDFHLTLLTGSTKVTEFLLSKGIPVDIDYGFGTPLYHACINEQDETVKVLLNHHANVISLTLSYFVLIYFQGSYG